MNDPISAENRSTFATLTAFIAFPYIWLGLFLLLSLMYGGNFFGQDFGGSLVAALLCLGLLNPFVPGLISNFIVRPILLNLLVREIVSTAGCLTGLVGFVITGLVMLYFLGREPGIALAIFAAAPVIGALLAAAVSFLGRGGIPIRTGNGGTTRGPQVRVEKPKPRSLPERSTPPRLSPPSKTPSRIPAPRRRERTKPSSRRVPPPRRRD